MIYSSLVVIHSWFRWIVVILGFVAAVTAIVGWLRRDQLRPALRWSLFFTIALDVQLLLGIALLSVTPWIHVLMTGDVMKNPVVRYWTFEHGFGMIVAIAIAHVGRVVARRGADVIAQNRRLAIFLAVSLLIILGTIPWPFMPYARPLFRL